MRRQRVIRDAPDIYNLAEYFATFDLTAEELAAIPLRPAVEPLRQPRRSRRTPDGPFLPIAPLLVDNPPATDLRFHQSIAQNIGDTRIAIHNTTVRYLRRMPGYRGLRDQTLPALEDEPVEATAATPLIHDQALERPDQQSYHSILQRGQATLRRFFSFGRGPPAAHPSNDTTSAGEDVDE
jgi:hypothetical protein